MVVIIIFLHDRRLDRPVWAEVITGQAVFAMVHPYRPAVFQDDIFNRAYGYADTAAVAAVVGGKRLIELIDQVSVGFGFIPLSQGYKAVMAHGFREIVYRHLQDIDKHVGRISPGSSPFDVLHIRSTMRSAFALCLSVFSNGFLNAFCTICIP